MNIFDLSASTNAVKLNETLNPTIWNKHEHLKNAVRAQILVGAEEYCSYLGLTESQIKDIVVSGDAASFKYTNKSPIDIVVIADLNPDPTFREFFNENNYKYNGQHQVHVDGHLVKFYVQPTDESFINNGSYSVLRESWVDIPKRTIKEDTVSKLKALESAAQPKPVVVPKVKPTVTKTRVTYGFRTPTVEDVGMSPGGVSPTTKMFLSEQEPTDEEILKDFIEFCVKELKIKSIPAVKLRRDPQWSVRNRTFGRYIDDIHTLEVAFGQRHIMDVLRTVAHELTHKHQHEREAVPGDAGETGSPFENEANARAGVLMRDYGRLHPELFDAGETDLEESASGYIPTKKQAKDPRWSMALTQDIRPGQLGKEANKLNLKTNKQGAPQIARSNGLVEALALQLEQFKKGKEEPWDRDGYEPPGPEFEPEFPEGTTKIDVADLTDWYRLGQDISDMDDADPADYGKGPPQTVVVFPSDEMEQPFLKQFKRLGLKAHDIDKGQEHLHEEQLDEVRMAPSNLMQWAKSPAAQGIRSGFEAELIFRDAVNDGDGDDMEPDYDADERCRSIQQIIDFFQDGDYGGMSPRQERALQEGLDEQYMEWQDEAMYDAWRDERDELIKEAWLRERPMGERIISALTDGMGIDDADADRILAAGDAAPRFTKFSDQQAYEQQNKDYELYREAEKIAEDILEEDVEQTIEKEDGFYDEVLDDFRNGFYTDDDSGFFSDVGLVYMSDVAEQYNLDWPYMTGGSNGGSRSWDEIGNSLADTIDMPVKVSSGYHSATRKPDLWIVEPDSSLDPDDREDYGLEIVSPPLPLLTALEKLQDVTDWANDTTEGNAYTNSSTGLHMGVSVPYKGGDVDYLKLVLFLGDEYVLQSFGREANTYTKSAMSKFRENIKGGRVDVAGTMKLMQNNLIELAQREVQKGVGTGKYTSAHIQNGYIEFRSAGGDWLAEESADPEKLSNTMLRYARAMQIAANPSEERREYAKKLYKLISPEGDDQLALFSQFTAGELTPEQLKKRWAEKTLSKEAPGAVTKGNWVVVDNNTGKTVPNQEYNGYTEDEVRDRAKAKISPASSDRDFDQAYSIHPKETGKWEVYRDDQGQDETLEIIDADRRGEAVDKAYDKYTGVIPFKVRAYYGDEEATPEKALSPRAKLAKRIVKTKPTQDYDVVYKPTGRVIDSILRVDAEQAQRLLSKVAQQHDFKNTDNLELRLKQEPEPDLTSGDWQFVRTDTGYVIDRVNSISPPQAEAVRRDWVRRYNLDDNQVSATRIQDTSAQQTYSNYADAQAVANQQNRREDDRPPSAGNTKRFRIADNEGNVWGPFVGDAQNAQNELRNIARANPDTELRIEWWGDDIAPEGEPDVAQNFNQQPEQARTGNGVPIWELYDKFSNSPLYTIINPSADTAWKSGLGWLRDHGAEDPATYTDRFGIRPKMNTVSENFADGKGPGRPGDSQRHGIPKGATIAQLEKAAKAPGRKGQLARWQLNMRRGKKK